MSGSGSDCASSPPRAGPTSGSARTPTLLGLQQVVADNLARDPHRVRAGSAARSPATRSSTCSPSAGRRGPGPGRHRGHAGGWCSAPTVRLVEPTRAHRLVVLGYPSMAEAADAVPALLPHRPVACEGLDARIVDVVRDPARSRRACRRPAARRRLAVRRGRRRLDAERGRRARVAVVGGLRRADDSASWSRRGRGGRALADPGGRRRARGAQPRGRPAHSGWEDAAVRRSGSAPTCASSTRCCAQHGLRRRALRPLRRRLRARADRLPASTQRDGARGFRSSSRPPPSWRAAHGGSLSGEHGDGRARSELLPLMYSAEVIACSAPSRASSTPTTCSTPACSVRPAAGCRRRPPGCSRRPLLKALSPDDGAPSAAAVHRCTAWSDAGRHRGHRCHRAPPLPGHPQPGPAQRGEVLRRR